MSKTIRLKDGHAIITPICRRNRGEQGAFDEAVQRLFERYAALLEYPINEKANYHLILEVEREMEE